MNPQIVLITGALTGIGRAAANRVGTSEEIANTITFLASDKASFISGASYLGDGGKSAR
jgi:NAD(P)-dependent dehydrogenase (short-subunit alcohol dehydrogenase family)